ncbi:MAG TPA: hypothetical protein VNA04_02425 [Thermoanaerobaculia bacterium]|nr:hypothetical protein [Thermoanaerobaculia bacterium]
MRALTALTLLLLAVPAAGSGLPSNLLDLSRRARYAVVADVTGHQTCPTADGHIFTYVSFANVKTLESEVGTPAPESIILRIPGGMIDGIVVMVTDAPVFRAGDRVLMFLTRDPQKQVPIVRGVAGVFLLPHDDTVRLMEGQPVILVDQIFDLTLDPWHKPSVEYARHWDPNMKAVIVDPPEWEPGNDPPPAQQKPLTFDQFRARLADAWREADRLGRLPKVLDSSPRRPYGEVPPDPRRQ